jgi:uncharacterized protein
VESAYRWKRTDVEHGVGMAVVRVGDEGIVVDAHEVVADEGQEWAVRFQVALDADWRTHGVDLTVFDRDGARDRQLRSDGAGSWTVDGQPDPRLDGCLDVDIGAVPITNTFPIRRTRLEPGGAVDLTIAFVDVPDLSVQPLAQTYRRLDDERWEYDDAEFGRYDLVVDRDGVVVDYSDFAHRI